MLLKKYKICYATAAILCVLIVVNACLGFSTFHDVSGLFGKVPVQWMMVIDFATAIFSVATTCFELWKEFFRSNKSSEFLLPSGVFCLICLLLSIMMTELCVVTLIEVTVGTMQATMNKTILAAYGQSFYLAETAAVDQMHRKFSCCGIGSEKRELHWQKSRWFQNQVNYPLQRIPLSCCVDVKEQEIIQSCKSVDSTFCDWMQSSYPNVLCSGNVVPPAGIHWEDLFYHKDCYPIVEDYVTAYAVRSLVLGIGNALTYMFFLVAHIRRYNLALSRATSQPFLVLLSSDDLTECYNLS